MMRQRLGWWFLVLLGIVGCSREVLVRNPEPLAAAASPDLTEQAILDALGSHGWSVEAIEPGHVVAFLAHRKYLLRVDIAYDAQVVALSYRDSDNLRERQGKSGALVAHKNVNRWMERLAQDIRRALVTTQGAPLPTAGGAALPPPGPVPPPDPHPVPAPAPAPAQGQPARAPGPPPPPPPPPG